MPTVFGTLSAIDAFFGADLSGFLEDRGSFIGTSLSHQALFTGTTTQFGVLAATDQLHQAFFSGVLVGDTTTATSDSSFSQGRLLQSTDMTLCLKEGSYFGWNLVDGTYVDGTYAVRSFNPLWVNYSIWYKTPPAGEPKVIQGYGLRPALNPQVGQFYANMYAPDQPGNYELRWRWQKEDETYAHEVIVPFTTISHGISSQSDYTSGV